MTTKLAVFRRQARVDTHVTLRLLRGDDVSGRITELDDAHVCIQLGDGTIVTVFEDVPPARLDRRQRGPGPAGTRR